MVARIDSGLCGLGVPRSAGRRVKGVGATKLAAWAMLYAAEAAQAGFRIHLAVIVPSVATLLPNDVVGNVLLSQPLACLVASIRHGKAKCASSDDCFAFEHGGFEADVVFVVVDVGCDFSTSELERFFEARERLIPLRRWIGGPSRGRAAVRF
jgi:hypothetical protein